MSQYISENKRTSLTRMIFSIRLKTLDIKEWNSWKYQNLFCLQCDEIETMDHFVNCQKYGEALDMDWKDINESNTEKQIKICEFVQKKTQNQREFNHTTRGWPGLYLRLRCSRDLVFCRASKE